jgi:t-SNARE complex subunit (syntaxin)
LSELTTDVQWHKIDALLLRQVAADLQAGKDARGTKRKRSDQQVFVVVVVVVVVFIVVCLTTILKLWI